MYKKITRTIHVLAGIVDRILKTDLPMDIWLDSEPFEGRR